MTLESAEAFIRASSESTQKQIELNNQSLINSLDAADRIIMRKAAETTIQLATQQPANPQ